MKKRILSMVAVASVFAAGCASPSTKTPGSAGSDSPGPVSAVAPPQEPTVTPPPVNPDPPKPKRSIPRPVRGMHLSGWYAGSPDLLEPLLTWAKSAGINTLILDVKAEDGKLSWESEIPMAKEIGANLRKVSDFPQMIQSLHDKGFWVGGRIVVMNDMVLYKAHPEWTIPGFTGGAYSFMNPKADGVLDYNISIAKAAAQAGVDEIQFDYVRYPERLVSGYNKDVTVQARTGAIGGFLKKAVAELKPMGVTVGADIFGLTTSVAEGDDMQIGQDYKQLAEIVDYVGPMIYPSHYANGTYGLDIPDNHPYETVKNTMQRALERSVGLPIEKHRPWIQDFTYPAAGARHYGPNEVNLQIKALHELGIDSFMLWDPSNKYSRGLDYTKPPQ